MAITTRQLDGQDFSISLTAPDVSVDVFAVNILTGTVTSAYLPPLWIPFVENSVALANSVVPPLDRTALNYLSRLIGIGSMDDSLLTGSSILVAPNMHALRITAIAGVDPVCILVTLPHSITGAFSFANAAMGGAPPVVLGGDIIGPSGANSIAAGVIVDADVSAFAAIQQSKIAGLVPDLASKVPNTRLVNAGAGLTGGGPLSADVTLGMPNVGVPGVYGAANQVPVFTTDAQGRVTNVVNTPVVFVPTTNAAQFSHSADQALVAGVPRTIFFNTIDYASGGVTVQNDGSGNPTRLTVPINGTYLFTLSPQMFHSGGGTVEIVFWARVNGVDIPNSASRLEMGNNNNTALPFIGLANPMLATQYLEWVFYTAGLNVSLESFPASLVPAIPATPSAIATVFFLGV